MAPKFSVNNRPVASLPQCPGVYRFLTADNQILYIGKSVNLRARVRSHLTGSGDASRRQRLLHATERIDCRPTAGEAGALLLENAAIKAEGPPFNRRQRAVRRLWSVTLQSDRNQFLQPQITSFSIDRTEVVEAYGCYNSRRHARRVVEIIAREAGLCPQCLGLTPGTGPCFQYQLKRCRGACVGREDAAAHNQRLLHALVERQLSAWPVTGPVLLFEEGADDSVQPPGEWHLLHNWGYMGTYTTPQAAVEGIDHIRVMFDRDTYRILRGILNNGRASLFCARTLTSISWPTPESVS